MKKQKYDINTNYALMYGPRMNDAINYYSTSDKMPDYDVKPTLDEGALDFLWLLAHATKPNNGE